jgi:regulatory protein
VRRSRSQAAGGSPTFSSNEGGRGDPAQDGGGGPPGGEDKTTEIAAVRLLARREHSTRDLKRKLEGKGHARDSVERVVNKLSDKKLLSDERFASSFVAHHGRRGQGPVRIRAELRQQGASDEVIDAALDGSGIDWAAMAAEVRARKFGAAPPKGLPERAKQARFLQYRGFSADQIRAALSGSAASAVEDELGLSGSDGFD